MDSTELDELLGAASTQYPEHELIQKLRGALEAGSKAGKAKDSELAEMTSKLQTFERSELFDAAGIDSSPTGLLLRKALEGEPDLTVERIQAEAQTYGLSSAPAPEAGVGEQQAHQVVASAVGEAPVPPPDIEARMAAASTEAEVLALAVEAGVAII